MTDSFTPPPTEEKSRPRLGTFLTANRTRLIVTAGALALLAGAPAAFGAVLTPQAASSVTSIVAETPAPSASAESASSTDASAADAATVASPAPSADPAPAPAAAPAEAPAEAPAPPAEAPAPAPAPPSNDYTVASGDTAGSIASNHGVNLNDMLAANGLGTWSVIYPGQVLKLTGPPVAVQAPASAVAPAAAPTTWQAPAPRAAAPAPAAAAPAPAPAPAPAVRTIYVAASGGQAMVDRCIGPIHFTPDDAWSLFIVEHDGCGGWARFSGIQVGETVNISGYGTYTVTGRGSVPNPGTTADVSRVLGGMPRAVLQTCIPGTSQMLVIGLN